MLPDAIASWFNKRQTRDDAGAASASFDPVHVAACALLLDIAFADGEFSPPEREHLERVLGHHFGLSEHEGQRLIALAHKERQSAVDHFAFTRVLQQRYDLGQKMVLAEVMWGLVLADGTVAEHEHYLTRKIANLLELEPGYLSAAKASAQARLPDGASRAPRQDTP